MTLARRFTLRRTQRLLCFLGQAVDIHKLYPPKQFVRNQILNQLRVLNTATAPGGVSRSDSGSAATPRQNAISRLCFANSILERLHQRQDVPRAVVPRAVDKKRRRSIDTASH